ncbi:aldehyde dehydrogenase family protein [Ornithinimicrobium cerasi]|uniref:aldehyde dehydrogenase family protein n=1 Tax=Ornithinimicrobium cerasi TaxID=2248773 RepID=UPI000EFE8A4D|nr:aldehyde dehydrogenase family protein [Ornithinimicrobium cerasi]
MSVSADRVDVRKTYKLYVGGKFPRSESGRSYEVYAAPRGARSAAAGTRGAFLGNVAKGSRKDARDAVVAARKAQPGWGGATAYNRGQVLYRVAEVMEGRRAQFVNEVQAAEGLTAARAEAVVSAAIDRWVWYAGWSDKYTQVDGSLNPVAGPYFNISAAEPTGVVAVLAPQRSSLLGLVSVVAPVVVSGNTAVVLASQDRPIPSVSLAESLATSDVPGGVVNIITGHTAEVAPWLASHRDVNALDLTGAADVEGMAWGDLERAAAENLKRVLRPAGGGSGAQEPDFLPTPDLTRLRAFTETKTVWHPKGT